MDGHRTGLPQGAREQNPAYRPTHRHHDPDRASTRSRRHRRCGNLQANADLYGHTVARLRAAGCVAADDEAALFIDAAPDAEALTAMIDERTTGVPPAWIVGETTFCDRRLRVPHGVYVPRPQTEELARRAAIQLAESAQRDARLPRAVDLCTGAGAIAHHLACEVPAASVIAVDIDPLAAACARSNGVAAVVGNLADGLAADAFDLVTAVAPYVPAHELHLLANDSRRHEPRRALDGGIDGLELVHRVIDGASRVLRSGGWLMMELGGDQAALLVPHLETTGFAEIESWTDDDGDLRGLMARSTPKSR